MVPNADSVSPLRVLIVAGSPAQAATLKGLFLGSFPGQVTVAEPAPDQPPSAVPHDLVVLDLSDLVHGHTDHLTLVRRACPRSPIVVIVGVASVQLERSLRAGGAADVLPLGFLQQLEAGATGIFLRILNAARDRHVARLATVDQEQALGTLLQSNRDGLVVVDSEGTVLAHNAAACEVLARHPDDLLGKPFDLQLPLGMTSQLQLRDNSGEPQDVTVNATVMPWKGHEAMLFRLRSREKAQQSIEGASLTDRLTGLPDRAFFMADLSRRAREAGESNASYAVLMIDLDRFKVVNDWFGRDSGDAMLELAASRIRRSIRPSDLAARIEGDKFAVLLRRIKHRDDGLVVGNRLTEVLSRPFNLNGREVSTTASVGIAYNNGTQLDADTILDFAHSGVDRAKREGGNRVAVFDKSLHEERVSSLRREAELHNAVENGDLRLVYQPVLDLSTGRITGLEALVRWDHRLEGSIAPSEFIELAEDSGLIVPLGEWVLNDACRQILQWHEWDPTMVIPPVSINLSNRQLLHPEFLGNFRRAAASIAETGAQLCVELTESAIHENPSLAAAVIGQLHDDGVEVHIDDFGAGFSSLAQLQSLPISTLKVDRSFVSRISEDPQTLEIVSAVVALAHALGLRAVAEGVETPEQKAALYQMGCDHAQGYLFARPLPPSEVYPMFWRAPVDRNGPLLAV